MDTLVARYSRPAYQQNENLFSEHDQDELNDSVPGLSLKFAMPPVAHVCFLPLPLSLALQLAVHTLGEQTR